VAWTVEQRPARLPRRRAGGEPEHAAAGRADYEAIADTARSSFNTEVRAEAGDTIDPTTPRRADGVRGTGRRLGARQGPQAPISQCQRLDALRRPDVGLEEARLLHGVVPPCRCVARDDYARQAGRGSGDLLPPR